MSNTITSPNMNLPVPVVSTDPGPDWASNINACMSGIDSHDHSAGKGVPITPDGMSISSDLPLNGNNLTTTRTVRFSSQSVPLSAGSDVGCIYEVGVDLYFNDGAGNQVRITQGGSVTGSSGTITGLPSGTASASYSAGTFTWQSATNTPATMATGPLKIGAQVASPHTVTLGASAGLAADINITLPTSLPASTSVIVMDSSGNQSSSRDLSISTVAVSGAASLTGGGTLSGTFAGNPTFSGTPVFNGGLNSPGVALLTGGGNFGGNFAGSPSFSGTPVFNGGLNSPGVALITGGGNLGGVFAGSPGFSGTPSFQAGAALTGTFSGNPTFSGTPVFSGTQTFNGTANFSGTTNITTGAVIGGGGTAASQKVKIATFSGTLLSGGSLATLAPSGATQCFSASGFWGNGSSNIVISGQFSGTGIHFVSSASAASVKIQNSDTSDWQYTVTVFYQ